MLRLPASHVRRKFRLERADVDPKVLAHRDQPQVRASDAQHRDRPGDRHVDFLRGVDDARPGSVFVCRSPRLARHRQRHQVRQGRPAGKEAVETLAPHRLGEPAHRRTLDRDRSRRRAPRGHVLVEHRCVEVTERAERFAGPDHIRKAAPSRRAHVLGHHAQVIDDCVPDTVLGCGQIKCRGRVSGHRRRNRPAALEAGNEVGRDARNCLRQPSKLIGGQLQRWHHQSLPDRSA
jgi:hypothetical protein